MDSIWIIMVVQRVLYIFRKVIFVLRNEVRYTIMPSSVVWWLSPQFWLVVTKFFRFNGGNVTTGLPMASRIKTSLDTCMSSRPSESVSRKWRQKAEEMNSIPFLMSNAVKGSRNIQTLTPLVSSSKSAFDNVSGRKNWQSTAEFIHNEYSSLNTLN